MVVVDVRMDSAERGCRDPCLGGQAFASHTTVTVNSEVAGMVELALSSFGSIDIMVKDAGTTHTSQPMLHIDEAVFDRSTLQREEHLRTSEERRSIVPNARVPERW